MKLKTRNIISQLLDYCQQLGRPSLALEDMLDDYGDEEAIKQIESVHKTLMEFDIYSKHEAAMDKASEDFMNNLCIIEYTN